MQRVLIYVLNGKIPNKEDFKVIEFEDWEEYYCRLKFIELFNEDEVLEDLTYRSLELYTDLYFVINGKEVFLKLKICSFDSQIELDSISEIVTEIADDEDGIVNNGRLLAHNYIPGSKFKNKTSEKTINVYREKGKEFKLNVPEEYEMCFNIIDVDNVKDIYKIEYRIDHSIGFKIYLELRGQTKMVIRNIKDRFNFVTPATNLKPDLQRIYKNCDYINYK